MKYFYNGQIYIHAKLSSIILYVSVFFSFEFNFHPSLQKLKISHPPHFLFNVLLMIKFSELYILTMTVLTSTNF